MRRLLGLIALLILILGAAWLAERDFDLDRMRADIDTLFSSESEGEASRASSDATVEETSAAGTQDSATAEADATATPGEPGPSAASPAADAAAEATPPEPDPTRQFAGQETTAAEPAEPESPSAAEPEVSTAEPETAMVDPTVADESAAAPPVAVVPSFDIVRVEPTGETVMAGISEPLAMVEVLNGPEAVATAEANERGEWALVLEVPLPPGTHDLGIRTTSQDKSQVTLSDQRVAVSVPETPDEEPLVVLNEPNAASRLLQVPEGAEAPSETEVAAAAETQGVAEEATPSAAGAETMNETPAAGAPEMAASEAEPPADAGQGPSAETSFAAAEPEAMTSPEPASPAAPPSAAETSSAETDVAMAPQPEAMTETPPAGGEPEASTSAAEPPATAGEATPLEPDPTRQFGSQETTAAEPAPSEPPTVATSESPASDAAPSAMAPETPPAAEAPAASTDAPAAPPSATASPSTETEMAAAPEPEPMPAPSMPADAAADSSTTGAGQSASEPPMGTEQQTASEAPSQSTETATVAPPADEPPAQSADAASSPAAEPPAAAAEGPPPVTPEVGVAAVEAETNGALFIAGTATTQESVRVYVDDEFVGEATPTESGTWLLETSREMAPDQYTVRVDQVDADNGAVIARAEVPFEREIDVATLKPTGESVSGGAAAELSGSVAGPMKVIIKRGDNLWRISRQVYGRGIRYSTIYQANSDQIRNPHLIYPGQVFVLPASDDAWDSQQ